MKISYFTETGNNLAVREKAFLVNSDCIRCGICTKVCPKNAIYLENEKK